MGAMLLFAGIVAFCWVLYWVTQEQQRQALGRKEPLPGILEEHELRDAVIKSVESDKKQS